MNRTVSTFAFVAVAAAALAASFATPALADDITPTPAFISTLSRADVQAEQQQFARDGVNPWADQHDVLKSFRSGATREEVRAEYLASREQVAAMSGEDSGSMYLASLVFRAPVRMAGDLDNLR